MAGKGVQETSGIGGIGKLSTMIQVPYSIQLVPELQIIFTVASVFTKQNLNLFSNLMSLQYRYS